MKEDQIINYMTHKRYIEGQYICWDFVMDIYRDSYGIELPEYPVDEVQSSFKHKLVANIPNVKIEKGQEREGDIIAFSMFANQHAGVMINNRDFIHLSREGVKVTTLSNLPANYTVYRRKNDV